MKTCLLCTSRPDVGAFYLHELKSIFHDTISFKLFISKSNSPPDINTIADIILVTNTDQVQYVQPFMHPNTTLINLNFSYPLDQIQALQRYPKGTKVKLYFSFPMMRRNIRGLFYENNIHNFIYVDYSDPTFDLLIIDNLTLSPYPDAPEIFSIGQRRIAFSTLFQIASSADVLNELMEKRIIQHSTGYTSLNTAFPYVYNNFMSSQMQLKTILDGIGDAIAILDHSLHLCHYNNQFFSLFKDCSSALNCPISQIPTLKFLVPCFQMNMPLNNFLTTSDTLGEMSISIKYLSQGIEASDSYILIAQPLNVINKRNQVLSRQIAKKGHQAHFTFTDIIAESPSMQRCIHTAQKIARIDKTTLVVGESGCGKEMLVQAIHSASKRSKYPFVSINCAAIPANLLESELFGYAEGAFTGSKRGGKQGLFELANQGTLFLDEVGEISLEAQSKLLRAIETREIMPVGSDSITTVDVRIIAATNKQLKTLVQEGKFRLDLYYRLNTITLEIPPLRSRPEDIPVLIDHFIWKELRHSRNIQPDLAHFFKNYSWEGNVRQLRNVIEYMVNITDDDLTMEDLPDYIKNETVSSGSEISQFSASVPENIDLPSFDQFSPIQMQVLRLIVLGVQNGDTSRNSLNAYLKEKGFTCSDYLLRKYLAALKGADLLSFERGPKGMSLTASGKKFLQQTSS